MVPQIIYLIIIVIDLIFIGYRHGKPKTGYNNAAVDIVALTISVGLIAWGGFFAPLFK